jgi:hypothetical protein
VLLVFLPEAQGRKNTMRVRSSAGRKTLRITWNRSFVTAFKKHTIRPYPESVKPSPHSHIPFSGLECFPPISYYLYFMCFFSWAFRIKILFNHSFHWHVQNATIPCRSQELFPFMLCNFSCHTSPPSILVSSLTSSCHLLLGLPLSLVWWKPFRCAISILYCTKTVIRHN